ncbi:hypothetical protein STRTUCAR8_04620 [Streptomyces turgidiscabies Car8]|uniref:Uncharacterized protein n=1 Tax=Streptomyces turgidiscabies (strain Car8) TaxID=698760 RepID=L7EZU8_STRT8|nr:hypothetical protein STRTUCAR8_04620 [Streptomyces turgidiscabies Car8]GAQ75522.1 hypothetical protein T45_07307 [Streptomyces turgidiscabies]
MTPTAQWDATPPADYQLLLPEGWFRVHIEPERREQSVDALVERQFKGIDNAPQIKAQLRQELIGQATKAFDEGGIELYLSLQQAGPFTVPASLLIALGLPPQGRRLPALDEIAGGLAAEGNDSREVSVVELPAGPALRVREEFNPARDRPPVGAEKEAEYALPSVTLDYQVQVPRAEAILLLTFSTPLVQIADAMVDLFDAVAGSLSWTEAA